MAVIRCDITRDGVRIDEGKAWAQTYRATYQIETDVEMGPVDVQTSARGAVTPRPVPSKGNFYSVDSETDLTAFALDFSWRRDPQNKLRWFCDVVWRPLDAKDTSANIIEPIPYNRAAVLWWEFEEGTEIVKYAKNITSLGHLAPARAAGTMGQIVNTAGQPFDTYPERPKSTPVLIIQRNYSTLAKVRQLHDTYIHKLNSDTFEGAAVKTLFVRRISCSAPINENGYTYYQGQIHLAYKPSTWKFELLNQGMAYLNADKKLVNVDKDNDGHVFTEPILLASNGTRLAADASTEAKVEYEYADTVSFANILQEP